MSWADAVEWTQKFQTAIVGVIGFAGVVVTLAVNARIAAAARKETIDHDRRALRVGLRQELSILKEAFEDRIKTISQSEPGTEILVPVGTMTPFYEASLGNLGLLEASELEKVMRVFGLAQQLPVKVGVLEADRQAPAGYLVVAHDWFPLVKGMHESMLPLMDDALAALH